MHEKHQSQLQKSQQQQLACYELNVSHSSLLATQLKFQRFSGDTCSSSKKSNPIARGSQHLSECHNRPAGRGGPLWQPTGRKCLSSLTMRARRRHSGFVCFHSCTEHTHLLIHSFIHRLFRLLLCSSIRAKVSFMCISQLTFRHFWSYRHRLSALPLPGFCGKFTIALPCLLHAGFAYNANLPLLSSK